jgi:tetratricopeptide (TPR) repeat protein
MKTVYYITALLALPLLLGIAPIKGPTDKGNEAFETGKYDDALNYYKDALTDDPESPEAHYNLGNAFYKLGDYDSALEEYLKAGKLDPEMADAYYNSGNAVFKMERYEDALKLYGRADEIRPDDPDTLHNMEITKKLIQKQKEQPGEGDKPGGEPGEQEEGGSVGIGKREADKPSDEDIASMLDRQAREERKLRGYFRPGRSESDTGLDPEMEALLRSLGIEPPGAPGDASKPFVERDW